ncbi:MAG: AI-2E family transporter [Bdellovibrionales bacterium]|nr:AI-2E family transporter [Bdellovibrionales bacterium]
MSLAISQTTLKRANRWKLVGLLTLLLTSFVVLMAVENLLVSALLAFVISYTLGPLVNYLERQGVSRTLATTVVFAGGAGVIGLIGVWLAPYLGETISRLQADTPRYISGLGAFISEMEIKVHSIAGPLSNFDLTSRVESQLTSWTHDFFEKLPGFVKTFFTVMLLGPFLAFFMVKDGRNLVRTVMGLAPNDLFETALSLQHQINFQIGQFVRARILESLIVGLVTAFGLFMISFPYPLLLGMFAGLMNLIPYLGPIFGAVPAFLIALVNGYSGLEVTALAMVYIVAQLIDAGFLIPLLVAKIVDLHPVTVILVIIAGAQLMGVLGMIISIPVAGTLKVTISTIYRHLIDTRA